VGTPGDAVVYAYAATTFDEAQLDLFRSIDGGLDWTARVPHDERRNLLEPFR
jgi:hypothetical protein